MYVSFNTGDSWEFLGQGIPTVTVGDIKIHPIENFLVAGTHGRGMYKINLDLVTGIETQKEEIIINHLVLAQNYPNPFNPSTTFSFSIKETGKVSLKVYDVLGNEVAIIVDAIKSTGKYEVVFNASYLPSGVYFYELQAGIFRQTRKMLLAK